MIDVRLADKIIRLKRKIKGLKDNANTLDFYSRDFHYNLKVYNIYLTLIYCPAEAFTRVAIL